MITRWHLFTRVVNVWRRYCQQWSWRCDIVAAIHFNSRWFKSKSTCPLLKCKKCSALSHGALQLMGDEGSYLPNCPTNLDIVLHTLSPLFWHFINQQLITWADKNLHLVLLKSPMPKFNLLFLWRCIMFVTTYIGRVLWTNSLPI